MASLFKDPSKISAYRDRRFPGNQEEYEYALKTSTTVYIGNMSFYTTEEQVYELFTRAGEIKKIIMGLDKNTKTPCGFCFVLYYSREDTEDAVKYISGTILDDRPIRVDFDWGFEDGRQWGRGRSGGQVRDEYRTDYDPGRGGYGKLVQKELEEQRELVDYGVGSLGDFQPDMPHPGRLHANHSDRGNRRPYTYERPRDGRGDRDYQRKRYRANVQSRSLFSLRHSILRHCFWSPPVKPTAMSSFGDLESPPLSSHSPLLSPDESAARPWRKSYLVSFALMLLMLSGLAAFIFFSGTDVTGLDPVHRDPIVMDRGVKAGVSMKGSGSGMLKADPYPWTNQMLSWQRTGFHFQPQKNWMNDPNGPMYYNGWYHFFYQYNPEAAVWGNIAWGHAVSKDLLNWVHLPLALVPDRSYDANGVWSGSATVLPDGRVIMLYTGLLNGTIQVQNIAVPANLSDPLLLKWNKVDEINPVMLPPHGVGSDDFRDPSTAWFEPSDSTWRVTIGARDASNSGMALVYSTKDFTTFTLLPNTLHAVEKVGMWECIDFYPIATSEAGANKGLDPSESPSLKTKHVLKASTCNNGPVNDGQADYYAIGTYDPIANTWMPDDKRLDVGVGLRYDWGRFYASKSFYDEVKQRRILWSWIKEADSERADITKGWASLQGIPRTVLYDLNTKTHLLTWPIEEVESLRTETKHKVKSEKIVRAGKTIELKVGGAAQLDVEVEFTIDKKALESVKGEDIVKYDCSKSGGAAQRGLLGPFGLLVLANEDLTEQTATYFYVSKKSDGSLVTHFCQDGSRSSKATDTVTDIVGYTVPVLNGESFTLRVLIDHSIVESFAQGGRASATSRVYPTEAIYDDARLFLFNNATGATVYATNLNVWYMNSATNRNLVDL